LNHRHSPLFHPGKQLRQLLLGKYRYPVFAKQGGGNAGTGFALSVKGTIIDKLTAAGWAAVGEQCCGTAFLLRCF
jgi:hypothetical protein